MGKYKNLISEALVLDTAFNLPNDQKTALKFLHKKYKDVKYDFELGMNQLIDDVETLGFSFTTSMKLAKLYKTQRDYIFKEYDEKYLFSSNSEILAEAFRKYILSGPEDELTRITRIRLKKSKLSKLYGEDSFYSSIWTSAWGSTISFYLIYEPRNDKDGNYLTYSESSKIKWKAVFRYDLSKLSELEGTIKSIPVTASIGDFEYNFPMPELNNSKDVFSLPVKLDVEEIDKKYILELVFGKKNSIFNHFENLVEEILKANN